MENKIEVLKTASEYIEKLKEAILTVSKHLQGSQYQNGLNMIPSIADGLNWLTAVIENTGDVLKSEISINEINDKLNEIVEALESQDNILVGDLFEYELLPILENAEKVINDSIAN